MPKLKTASTEPKTAGDLSQGGTSRQQLYSYVQRFERLQEEKEALAADQREVMDEAKGTGFDTATIRKVIQRRKKDPGDLQESDAMVDLYETTVAAAEKDELAQSEADAE
jgi:uncharacterized protein (UPF0335 family)